MNPNIDTLKHLINEFAQAVKQDIDSAENILDKIRQNIPDSVEQIQIDDDTLKTFFSSLLIVVNNKMTAPTARKSTKSLRSASIDDF